jgi:hypothetical protein
MLDGVGLKSEIACDELRTGDQGPWPSMLCPKMKISYEGVAASLSHIRDTPCKDCPQQCPSAWGEKAAQCIVQVAVIKGMYSLPDAQQIEVHAQQGYSDFLSSDTLAGKGQ